MSWILTLHCLPVGFTPLHVAANGGNYELFKQLCIAEPDVDLQDAKSGKTALHYAVERGDLSMTGFIVTDVCSPSVYLCL